MPDAIGPPRLITIVSHQGMSDAFQQLCSDVDRATRFTHLFEDRRPHYQRVLDYILAHPEERDTIAASLSRSLTEEPGAARLASTCFSLLWSHFTGRRSRPQHRNDSMTEAMPGTHTRSRSSLKPMRQANHTIQRMRPSRLRRSQFERPWRLARTADGDRWAHRP